MVTVGPYYPYDITNYFGVYMPNGQPKPNVYPYTVNNAPSPGLDSVDDLTGTNGESSLDIQMAGSIAPGSNIVFTYKSVPQYQHQSVINIQPTDIDDCINGILNPSPSAPSVLDQTSVISISWGDESEPTDQVWNSYVQQANARGITVLAAVGDSGNNNNHPSWPASASFDNYGTIAVGGVKAILSGSQSEDGRSTNGIASEEGWSFSEGGPSTTYSEPSWQSGSSNADSEIGSNERGTPDISGPAQNILYYLTIWVDGERQEKLIDSEAGTSFATPLLAGKIAWINHYSVTVLDKGTEGFFLPAIYNIGQKQYEGKYSGHSPFYDATSGDTNYYQAKTGYDLVTGWGSINALNFLQAQYGVEINILNPTANYSTQTSSFDFKVDGYSIYGINSFKLYLGSSMIKDCSSSSMPCSVSINPQSSGSYILTAKAYDSEGTYSYKSLIVIFDIGGGGSGCVFQNTPILMANNKYKMVQNLKIGDLLLGYNFENDLISYVRLTNLTMTRQNEILNINDRFLALTPTDQPIFIRNSTYIGWVRDPRDLKIGDELFEPVTDSWVSITSLTYQSGNFKVYDVKTDPFNNFIAKGILLDQKTP